MIRLENVTYRYESGGDAVLRHLNLTVQPGESVCVMGANGSGKSTLAKLLAGLIVAEGGRVRVEIPSPSPLPVGMLFQNPDNQMVSVTVDKEIAFALENLGVPLPEMENRISQTLERFSISHLRHRLTSELSGGEKQRVALAAVMVFQPSILVLDEPDSFLDESGKATLMQELAKLKAANAEMIQVHITQYPATARRYPRLVVLDEGRVAADGAPEQIFGDRMLCLKTGLSFDLDGDRKLKLPATLLNDRNDRSPGLEAILLRRASFRYPGERDILKNVSVRLSRGETLGLVGPSGSGKSSLALMLCGLLKPTDGEIEYLDAGSNPLSREHSVGRVAAAFQQPERQFFLSTSAAEISFGPKNLGRTLSREEVYAMLALVGLEPKTYGSKDPFTLSGGEKRRLAFASILSLSPQFAVFDEPTCGLDQEGVGRFILLSQALKRRRVGQVIISHDGDVIRTLADRIVYLQGDTGWTELSSADFFEGNRWAGVVSTPTG
jgi:energy-coupling factor transport system ATP-binding protein